MKKLTEKRHYSHNKIEIYQRVPALLAWLQF